MHRTMPFVHNTVAQCNKFTMQYVHNAVSIQVLLAQLDQLRHTCLVTSIILILIVSSPPSSSSSSTLFIASSIPGNVFLIAHPAKMCFFAIFCECLIPLFFQKTAAKLAANRDKAQKYICGTIGLHSKSLKGFCIPTTVQDIT